MREIIVDTETTGLDYKGGDRIIELACVELINHISTGKYIQFYCSTNKSINQEAQKIHGLSNSFLSKFPNFESQIPKFLDFVKNDKLVIHNAIFDVGFINNELRLSGYDSIKNDIIDTVSLARKKLRTRVANLDFLCKKFSIDLTNRKYHGALLDCYLLAEVYLELKGGRQTILEFKNKEEENKEKKPETHSFVKKTHKIKILENEIMEHKNFIAELKGALWHKVNY